MPKKTDQMIVSRGERYPQGSGMSRSWVYFIQEIEKDGTPGAYKIGKANNPDERASTFQTGNSRELIIRHVEPGGLPEEGVHHRRFGRYQIRRGGKKTEWFDDRDGKIAAYIAAAPKYGRGPADPWGGVWRGFWRGLGLVPRGGWRIIFGTVAFLFTRKSKHGRPAWTALSAASVSGGAHLSLEPAIAMPVMVATVLAACLLEGRRR